MRFYFMMLVGVLTGCICFAQSISVGVTAGVLTTDDLSGAGATGASKRYVVGPAVDIGLPFGLGVEVGALYRREGYQSSFSSFAYSIFSGERANSWEFPMTVKYRIPFAVGQPFVEAGYAPRVIHGTVSSNFSSVFPNVGFLHSTTSTDWPVSHGVVGGGGVQFGIGRVRLAPEVRYTHRNNIAISGYYGDGPSWQPTQNQVDVLVNIGWKVR